MPGDFRSDNVRGCSPEVAEAIVRINRRTAPPYGRDTLTHQVRDRCCQIFETDVEIFPVVSGTAGNALSIATLTPPWGAVFCHEDAHIERDECGAPEFFSGGAKLVTLAGADGKLHPDELRSRIAQLGASRGNSVAACVSITNATEAGTVYSARETAALCDIAGNLGVHMDGARFANAVVSTGASPADLTWRCGVDIVALGATKNGGVNAEAIVVFRKELAAEMALRHHRSGHRVAKMRFLSAQLDAYFADDLWLRNARHANSMATRIARAFDDAGCEIAQRVDANVVFVRLTRELAEHLEQQDFLFYDWPVLGPDVYRFVAGFDTPESDAAALAAALYSFRDASRHSLKGESHA